MGGGQRGQCPPIFVFAPPSPRFISCPPHGIFLGGKSCFFWPEKNVKISARKSLRKLAKTFAPPILILPLPISRSWRRPWGGRVFYSSCAMIPRARKRSNFKYSCFFNEYNKSSLQEINKTVKGFQKQIRALQDELESTNKELKDVTIENQKLKQTPKFSDGHSGADSGANSGATFSIAVATASLLFLLSAKSGCTIVFFSRKSGSASASNFKQIICRCHYC